MNELQLALAQPFAPNMIVWKPGASKENKCMAMAYADLRAYMNRLDEICGMEWTVEYEPWGDNRIIARLTINGVTRASTGEMDGQDEKSGIGGTSAEAQAFKRAAAMFGLGRYLYDLPSVWVEFDAQRKRITEAGQRELDTRYKDWYKRSTSVAATQTPQNGTNGHNGHNPLPACARAEHTTVIVEPPVAPENPFEEDAGTPPHQRMWGMGLSCFGPDWNMARPWLLKKYTSKLTPDNVRTSAADLSDDEKDALADYLSENCKALKGIWPNQKKIMLQAEIAAN